MKQIYLDHAATTPVPRAVAETMAEVLTDEINAAARRAYFLPIFKYC